MGRRRFGENGARSLTEPVLRSPFSDLGALPPSRLRIMHEAERDLFQILNRFSREGRHPVGDLFAVAEGPFTTFTRYPSDGVGDAADGFAWYYHAHDPAADRPWGENGHFHCFAYTESLGSTASPWALPPMPDLEAGGLIHLVAVCVNAEGVPDRLFTLNRWASDEWLYRAEDVIPLVDRFRVRRDPRFPLTSRWLSALLRLLQPQIAWLLQERDAVLTDLWGRHPEGFSEDPSVEVTSTLTFDLDDHLAALGCAYERLKERDPALPNRGRKPGR